MIESEGRAIQLTARGVSKCRGCGISDLASVLDLGLQPLANELLRSQDEYDDCFPLHLKICQQCGLGQIGEYVLPDRIFRDYPYLSSMSSSWIEHARNYAMEQTRRLGLDQDQWVLEVASNDGYLLREFAAMGVNVLGVEPAANVADIARAGGVPTVTDFFGEAAAMNLREEYGVPRLIVANNVMAHVPDLEDFMLGFAVLSDENTLISVENPSFATLLSKGQFDTIYHEHFSYLTARAVAVVALRHGLELVDVEQLTTHGGSNRYWLGLAGHHSVTTRVQSVIQDELASGLLDPETHSRFESEARETIAGLRTWIEARRDQGKLVAAYGAAAKGNTLLNAAAIDSSVIRFVVDASPEKQGRFLPGSRIPILALEALAEFNPEEILLLPWNLKSEITGFVGEQCPGSQLWIAVPRMECVAT